MNEKLAPASVTVPSGPDARTVSGGVVSGAGVGDGAGVGSGDGTGVGSGDGTGVGSGEGTGVGSGEGTGSGGRGTGVATGAGLPGDLGFLTRKRVGADVADCCSVRFAFRGFVWERRSSYQSLIPSASVSGLRGFVWERRTS